MKFAKNPLILLKYNKDTVSSISLLNISDKTNSFSHFYSHFPFSPDDVNVYVYEIYGDLRKVL